MTDITTTPKAASAAKRITKRDQLIKMLRRKAGADIAGLSKAFGWQPHSTRAALTGLRKAGFLIEKATAKSSGKTVYRIVGSAQTKAEIASDTK